jgi:hypothetical protein
MYSITFGSQNFAKPTKKGVLPAECAPKKFLFMLIMRYQIFYACELAVKIFVHAQIAQPALKSQKFTKFLKQKPKVPKERKFLK